MQHSILFLVLSTWIADLAVAETKTNDEKCGKLRPKQLYNLKKIVEPTEFPWMAVLLYKPELRDMNLQRNLATLISKQYLITALSFLVPAPPIAVIFDPADMTSYISDGPCQNDSTNCPEVAEIERVDYTPSGFYKHTTYTKLKEMFTKDIGTITLKVAITITDSLRPICLLSPNEIARDFAAQHLSLAGLIQNSTTLSKKYVQVVDANICSGISGDSGDYVCANSCENGSSYKLGSALMGVKVNRSIADYYYLVGILVKRQKFCVDSTPDIYVRVYNFRNLFPFVINDRYTEGNLQLEIVGDLEL